MIWLQLVVSMALIALALLIQKLYIPLSLYYDTYKEIGVILLIGLILANNMLVAVSIITDIVRHNEK